MRNGASTVRHIFTGRLVWQPPAPDYTLLSILLPSKYTGVETFLVRRIFVSTEFYARIWGAKKSVTLMSGKIKWNKVVEVSLWQWRKSTCEKGGRYRMFLEQRGGAIFSLCNK